MARMFHPSPPPISDDMGARRPRVNHAAFLGNPCSRKETEPLVGGPSRAMARRMVAPIPPTPDPPPSLLLALRPVRSRACARDAVLQSFTGRQLSSANAPAPCPLGPDASGRVASWLRVAEHTRSGARRGTVSAWRKARRRSRSYCRGSALTLHPRFTPPPVVVADGSGGGGEARGPYDLERLQRRAPRATSVSVAGRRRFVKCTFLSSCFVGNAGVVWLTRPFRGTSGRPSMRSPCWVSIPGMRVEHAGVVVE